MTNWIVWVGIAALAVLTLFSTLNLSLHLPVRGRLAEQFSRGGRNNVHDSLLDARLDYILATGVVRSAAVFTVLLSTLAYVEAYTTRSTPALAAGCATALFLVFVFGTAIPSAWARYTGGWLLVRLLLLLKLVRVVCFPLILVLRAFDPFVRRLAGAPPPDAQTEADELEQEILHAVSEGERHGAVDQEEKEMIESVIELAETRVDSVMTPRTDIVALSKDAAEDVVLETIRSEGHSRIPVYNESIDSILGILYAKDLLQRERDAPFDLTLMIRKAYFVPESKLVRDLLREFQTQKVHIAIVLDEYGGTAGLVTIEDILEELVGEITDEYEEDAPEELRRIDERTVEVDARVGISDLNDQLGISLPEDEDYETIGGFVFSTMGRIPEIGETCVVDNVTIRIMAAEPQRVLRLQLTVTPAADGHSTG